MEIIKIDDSYVTDVKNILVKNILVKNILVKNILRKAYLPLLEK